MLGIQLQGGVIGQYILQAVFGGQLMMLAEGDTGFDQRRVEFQAGQLLAVRLQQAPAQMALACAPVQPVSRVVDKAQMAGEGFDLLPFAPRHIDIQARACRGQINAG
ncbi:hypothetical protein D3C78_845640 [compost metagenome]